MLFLKEIERIDRIFFQGCVPLWIMCKVLVRNFLCFEGVLVSETRKRLTELWLLIGINRLRDGYCCTFSCCTLSDNFNSCLFSQFSCQTPLGN